ncbi:MAG: Leucyl-tRNA synthetase, partial [uncultured Nocardioides sp.]
RGTAVRGPPLQRDGRPHDGAGERHAQGDRLRLWSCRPCCAGGRRDGRHPAVAGRALRRGGDVGAAGSPADRRPCRVAGRRRGAAGRGLGDRGGPGPGQGPRAPGGLSRHLRGRLGGGGAGRRGGRACPRRQSGAEGRRTCSQAGQHRRV